MNASDRVQSDIKKLKTKYNVQLSTLKELFSDWTEEDLLFTLQDTDGDLEIAIDRISEGHANQWDEVKPKKSKKEAAAANKPTPEASSVPISTTPAVTMTTTSYPSNNSKYTNRHSKQQRPISTSNRPVNYQQKSQTSWQGDKKSDFDGWSLHSKPTDSWNSWKQSTPKKTPSSRTHGKTWASLLQSNPEPENVPVEKDLPPLKKVDNAWLYPADQWNNVNTTTTTTTAAAAAAAEKGDTLSNDIPIDLSTLSIHDEKDNSNHTDVADLLNSVKHNEPQLIEPITTTTNITNTTNIPSITPHTTPAAPIQPYHTFETTFNPGMHDYGMYGGSDQFFQLQQQYQRPTYYDQKFGSPKQEVQKPLENDLHQPQSYNNLYPYYYNQPFNAYSPYGQSNKYPYQNTTPFSAASSSSTTTTSVQSPYMSSPYHAQNLYGNGFNGFGEETDKSSTQHYSSMFSSYRTTTNSQPYWN